MNDTIYTKLKELSSVMQRLEKYQELKIALMKIKRVVKNSEVRGLICRVAIMTPEDLAKMLPNPGKVNQVRCAIFGALFELGKKSIRTFTAHPLLIGEKSLKFLLNLGVVGVRPGGG